MTEIEPCPKCGALPCDWTANPHTAPSGDEVQRVARAIHGAKMEGHNPDCLYEHHECENWPVDDRREYADPFTGKTRVQLFHKAWRRYESAAQAAIAAMRPASGELVDDVELTIVAKRCVYLNDYRIAGGKPYVSENLPQHSFTVKVSDLLRALPMLQLKECQ